MKTLLLWMVCPLIFTGCVKDDQRMVAGVDENAPAGKTTSNIPESTIDPEVALREKQIDVRDISETRTLVQPRSATAEETVAAARREKLRTSPFYQDVPCQDWSGKDTDVSAACCRAVIGRYAAIYLSPGDTDLGLFAANDPYLGACKVFNAEFRTAIDLIEHPEEEDGDGTPPF